jgi:hypothetical protein
VQPADIALVLRRRSPWEAMDLGLVMLQRWWRQVYAPHLVVGGVVAASALAIAWALERPWVAIALVWWLKPLYDRVVLHVLSRAVFGELQGVRAVFAATGQWLRTGLAAYLAARLWPDLARSFNLPVRQLEGQTWRAGRARRAGRGGRARGHAVWLTLVCLHFEAVLYWSFQTAAGLLLPAKSWEGREFWETLFSGEAWSYGDALAYAAAVLVLEPFYVAAGFALYLNRRTLLEGWDIEVALRKIAARHAAAAAGILVGIFLVFHPVPSHAQKDPKREIAEVLKAPEFPHERETMQWRLRRASSPSGDLDWLRALGHAFAKVTEVAFWIIAGLALAYALWWAARMLPRLRVAAPEPYRPPAALFGMALAPDSLPDDVAAAAAALAREGRLREALSLLYRGALSELVHRRGVRLLASHTEAEVLQLAPAECRNSIKALIDAWRLCAYARRDPRAADIEHLVQDYRTFAA